MRLLLIAIASLVSWTQAFALDSLSEAEDRRDFSAPALQHALVSQQAELRERAAQILGRLQQPVGVDPLLALLHDGDSRVQREAAFALGQLGWESAFSNAREAEIAQALSGMLTSPSAKTRKVVIEALGKVALTQAPALLALALDDPTASVRGEAILALFRARLVQRLRDPSVLVPDLPQTVFERFKALAQDKNSSVRQQVAYYFSRVRDTRAAELLPALAHDKVRGVRYHAINALARLADQSLVASVLSSTKDARPYVRIAAIQAALAMKGVSQLPASLATDTHALVRAAYAQALVDVMPAPLATLAALRQDSSPTVRGEALKTLARVDVAHAAEAVNSALQDPTWMVREAAVAASITLDDATRTAFLLEATKDLDVHVRAAAIEALAPMADPAAYLAIEKAAASSELAERGSAVGTLVSRPAEEQSQVLALSWSIYQDSGGEKWTEVRESLVSVWATIPDAASTAHLKAAAADPAPSVSAAAIKALQTLGESNLPSPPTPALSFSPYREFRFNHNPHIRLETTRGLVVLELFAQAAPLHVANLFGFVKVGGYDGLPIHRVVPNFVVQGGDPDGTGWGSAGYSLRAEINGMRFERGSLGMPRSQGFDTGGVQFFISHIPTPHLDGQYTVFGRVVQGMDVVDTLEVGDLVIRATAQD